MKKDMHVPMNGAAFIRAKYQIGVECRIRLETWKEKRCHPSKVPPMGQTE
jgi:hypothetical protein